MGPLGGGEAPERLFLAFPPHQLSVDLAGAYAVHHGQAGAEHVVDSQFCGQTVDLERQGGRGYHDYMTALAMAGDAPDRVGKEPSPEGIPGQSRPERLQAGDGPALEGHHPAAHEVGHVGPTRRDLGTPHHQTHSLVGTDVSPSGPIAQDRDGRVAVYESSVEIEYGGDAGCGYCGHRVQPPGGTGGSRRFARSSCWIARRRANTSWISAANACLATSLLSPPDSRFRLLASWIPVRNRWTETASGVDTRRCSRYCWPRPRQDRTSCSSSTRSRP